MEISLRTHCITIGSILFSLVPLVMVVALAINSCEGGCGDVHLQVRNGTYLLIGMYSPIGISTLIDYFSSKSKIQKLDEVK